ncbi:glycerol-3-phosphate dehydrogenase [Mangrovitalea sediminis]|uniref:glycerol-3-phosphate dehydrogenase n=1 Tax=Mangrovitalea sediminis TaxID=1982043 RepID=UPI000BE6083E|nr:glycerol-3-phosphate dehydrogenase [Mangrovitalea sediminis]
MLSLTAPTYDLFVIGGGINGTGIAADASGRGLSVMLCEQSDLASATSSASSKLIHGGLRYLEYYEFRLVREALAEREVLLRNAPHLVEPLRFTLPHRPHLRPAWVIRCGLFLYDHLSRRTTLPAARSIRFGVNSPLKPNIRKGFMYSDCWVDDARLVIANAQAASARGARIATRTRCISARRHPEDDVWEIRCQSMNGEEETVYARALVNAAGPWAASLFDNVLHTPSPRRLKLIKGSHIIVPRFQEWHGAFILQNTDRRIVFVLPYQDDFSLIGTTDKIYSGDPAKVSIDDEETDYLLKVVNEHFVTQLSRQDIVSAYSGVRPLCDDESADPSAMTRDYTVEVTSENGQLPILSVFGGKITTYRKLAEAALAHLRPWFPQMGQDWTAEAPLPGATAQLNTRQALLELLTELYPALPAPLLKRYARSYGTHAMRFLGDAKSVNDLGHHFGAGLYEREVRHLIEDEWAETAEDILWRRTKLGLKLSEAQRVQLSNYLEARITNTPKALAEA